MKLHFFQNADEPEQGTYLKNEYIYGIDKVGEVYQVLMLAPDKSNIVPLNVTAPSVKSYLHHMEFIS